MYRPNRGAHQVLLAGTVLATSAVPVRREMHAVLRAAARLDTGARFPTRGVSVTSAKPPR